MKSFKYFPETDADIKAMLETIGVESIDDLFADVPDILKTDDFALEPALSEMELRQKLKEKAAENKKLISFCGGGCYDVYIPAVIPALLSRQEFLTSYTPYQAEISQGTLAYIFEFQSYIVELTGMDVANASLYDGATASAEAVMMAAGRSKRKKFIVSGTVNPRYRSVIGTYAKYRGYSMLDGGEKDCLTDPNAIVSMIDDDTFAVVCQYPDYYGYLEDYPFVPLLKEKKILFIVISDPSALAVCKTPAEFGADIVCGEAQTLGIRQSFGGPFLGYLACRRELLRRMPGRIVGMTTDSNGKKGFVLTLQAREQHIRREKATSNICSNESLLALNAVIYCSLLGAKGLKEVQMLRAEKSHKLRNLLLETGSFSDPNNEDFIGEFTLSTETINLEKLNAFLAEKGFLGGISEGNRWILCATEMRTDEEISRFGLLVRDFIGGNHDDL